MIQAIYGTKTRQSQLFLTDGSRIPVTLLRVASMPVMQVKTNDKDGYSAIQVGLGVAKKKQVTKPEMGHIAKVKLDSLPKHLVEIRDNTGENMPEVGSFVHLKDVLKPGDIIDVTGTSKGKGFAGGVKRHQFKGGPRTHGQSDRERAPGSLGQTTTPGRVYKGKRMAGHMGQDTATVTNLLVIAVSGDTLYVKGLVPGSVNSIVRVNKKGESKKFTPSLLAEEVAIEGDQPLAEGEKEVVAEVAEAPVEVAEEAKEATASQEVAASTPENASEVSEAKDEKKTASAESAGESKEEQDAGK